MINKIDELNDNYIKTHSKKDKKKLLDFLKGREYLLLYLDESLLKDKEIVTMCVTKYGSLLRKVDESFKNNKEFMMKIISISGLSINYASDKLKDDKELAITAIKENVFAYDYISERLKQNKDIINLFYELIKDENLIPNTKEKFIKFFDGGSLEEYSDLDTEIYIIKKEKLGIALSSASYEVKDDPDTVEKAIETNPMSILFASNEVKKDKSLIEKAICLNPLLKNIL